MQILLRNSGMTAEYDCYFRETQIIYYPNGKVEYALGDDDMSMNFRCAANLEYIDKFGEPKWKDISYHVYFINDVAYMDIRNKADKSFARVRLKLTDLELDILKSATHK